MSIIPNKYKLDDIAGNIWGLLVKYELSKDEIKYVIEKIIINGDTYDEVSVKSFIEQLSERSI